jgi:ATP-dependent DNA helicase RecG
LRELVVNALVHRDYDLAAAVEVEHSPESLAVTSPGGLVFGVTPENILTYPSTPRHRLLLDAITLLQVAERTGQGIDRAYRELLRVGKSPPQVTDDGLQVRVVVPGGAGNDAFARFVASLEPSLGRDVDVLLAMSCLREQRSVDALELSHAIQRPPSDAQSVLERLVHAGLLDPTRRTARRQFPSYALTAEALAGLGRAVRYHFRRTDETDRKVVAHVREYGSVTNQALRRLFDIEVFAARDLLRDLQQRQVLRKLDPARAGPGIRYGPGARFPAPTGGRARSAQRGRSFGEPDGALAEQLPLDVGDSD